MEKEKLIPWIEKLNAEHDGKKRNAIVAEMCKAHGVKLGDAYKALKEAGYDPKAAPPAAPTLSASKDSNDTPKSETDATVSNVARSGANGGVPPPNTEGNGTDTPPPDTGDDDEDTPPPELETEAEKKITVTLRHKTEYPRYRRAGLVLSQKAQSYEVSVAQLAALKKDKWVVIEGVEK
jgi:hypothetical protein